MANERITENIVRDKLRDLGYMVNPDVTVEEQASKEETIRRLLRNAGKAGKGGKGAPEFIIQPNEAKDVVIIIECKPETRQHESVNGQSPVQYAVDGVLHYAKFLSEEYNVIAIAVSGSTDSELKISSFLWPSEQTEPKILTSRTGAQIKDIVDLDTYLDAAIYKPEVQLLRLNNLLAFSHELHDFMRDHAKLTENEKPLLVSGTLIAFRNKAFREGYKHYEPDELQDAWLEAIRKEIEKANIPNPTKKLNMLQPYSSISVHPELGKSSTMFKKGVLNELIKMLLEKVWPYVSVYHDYDVVGRFYGEFLKYTGGDKKALGIVLTPRHVTELFAHLARLQKDSKVLDTCCGTGGFLISAMHYMLPQASTVEEEENIKRNCLVGIEQQPNMYALAASNMMLRGDGKANLYQGSCFDQSIIDAVKTHSCDVGFINPPYSQRDDGSKELVFIREMLDMLEPGGTGIAIVPIGCAISPSPLKAELLKHHTLEAVMSMPDELFYPVGVVTCIMIFKAHVPHVQSNQKTWFGYWKKDGFTKTKHLGRIDQHNSWSSIRDRWVSAYINREDVAGESVKYYVTADDEWCAEAYMETDYTSLSPADFDATLRDYAIYNLVTNANDYETSAP